MGRMAIELDSGQSVEVVADDQKIVNIITMVHDYYNPDDTAATPIVKAQRVLHHMVRHLRDSAAIVISNEENDNMRVIMSQRLGDVEIPITEV